MIEHEFAAMPAREARHQHRKDGERESMRQDRLHVDHPHSPVKPSDCHQRHGRDSVRPACLTQPNARNKQQLCRTYHAGRNTCPESEAGRPDSHPGPKRITRPPVKNINSQGGHHKSNGKVHHHYVDRMSYKCDGRADLKPKQLEGNGILTLAVKGYSFSHAFVPRSQVCFAAGYSTLRAGVYLSAAAGLTGCAGPLSTLDPAGPVAASIAMLWWAMLIVAALLLALVMSLFLLSLLRPGWGSFVPINWWLFIGGLGIPAVVLPPLIVFALVAGEHLLPVRGLRPLRVEATATQWRWTFSYPGYEDKETRDLLFLPAGVPVDLVITSRDVIHSFWVPRLAGKIDAVPGHANIIRLQADQPGRYSGLCNQFCGEGHSGMRFDVIVYSANDFATALNELLPARGR